MYTKTTLIIKAKIDVETNPSTKAILEQATEEFRTITALASRQLYKLTLSAQISHLTPKHEIKDAAEDAVRFFVESNFPSIKHRIINDAAYYVTNKYSLFLKARNAGNKAGVHLPLNTLAFLYPQLELGKTEIVVPFPINTDSDDIFKLTLHCAEPHLALLHKDQQWYPLICEIQKKKDEWFAYISICKHIFLKKPSAFPAIAILTNKNPQLPYSFFILAFLSPTEFCTFYLPNRNYLHVLNEHKKTKVKMKRTEKFKEWYTHTLSAAIVDWIIQFAIHDKRNVPNIYIAKNYDADKSLVKKVQYKLQLKRIPTSISYIDRLKERFVCPKCRTPFRENGNMLEYICPNTQCTATYNRHWIIARYIVPHNVALCQRYNFILNTLNIPAWNIERILMCEVALKTRIAELKQGKS